MILLVLYGFLPTLQPTHFGRVLTAYGGYIYCPVTTLGMESGRHRPRQT